VGLRLWRPRVALPTLVGLIAFAVYWRTLLPTVSAWGDSAKFQYLAQVWGIPHPTGYPLYLLLTRLFALLPLGGEVAYRVNLLSAVCAASAVGFLALTAAKLIGRPPLGSGDHLTAVAAALSLAFSPIFWSQATVAEVYALNALFVVLCLALLLRWWETEEAGVLHTFLLVYGLSFSHHLSMVLLLPAFLYLIARRQPRAFVQPRHILFGLLGVGLGLIPYSYILLRAAQGAAYSEFPPLNDPALPALLSAFVDYLTGAGFRRSFFAVFAQGPTALLTRGQWYVRLLGEQFGWWGVILGLAGLVSLGRRDGPQALGLGLAFIGETIFPLGYQVIDPEVFFIPSYLIWALFIAQGLGWLRQTMSRLAQRRRPILALGRWLFLGLCLALPVVPLTRNWATADRSHDFSARRWAEAFLQDMEPNAMVVLPQPYFYSQKQTLLYLMVVEGVVPNLEFIEADEIDRWVGRRPVYLAVWMPEIAERYSLQAVDSSELTLADFLAGLPEGTIVAAAVKDEASLGLSAAAAQSWTTTGGLVDLRGCFRCAHALIGVKGAAPGTALELSGHKLLSLRVEKGTEIGGTGVRAPADIVVRSAGFDQGNVGEIWVNGRPVSPEHRGYNIVALDPETGRLLTAVYADTFESDLVDNVRKYRVLVRGGSFRLHTKTGGLPVECCWRIHRRGR